MKITVGFVLWTFMFVCIAQETAIQNIESAVKHLGTDSFEERENASKYLWTHGLKAHSL